MPRISVVVPVLNESSLIAELISRVVSNLEKLTSDFEIILIDDGSEDNTWEIISKYSLIEQRIKGLKLSRNFGHHYAITAGINHTGGDWVVVMDGDLQDRPEVIPELYAKAQEGFEIVFVSRKNRPEKIYYRLAQKTFYVILRFLSGIVISNGKFFSNFLENSILCSSHFSFVCPIDRWVTRISVQTPILTPSR
jgi:dolichol-phosphate mannosyltransferase